MPIRPYGFAPLPEIDRLMTTSAPMMEDHSTDVVQVWRLSDLRLLRTLRVPPDRLPSGEELVWVSPEGERVATGHRLPSVPRVMADGSVLLNAYGCGFYLLTGMDAPEHFGSRGLLSRARRNMCGSYDPSPVPPPMEETRLTSPERCAAVCAEPEPVLRNLQITLSYYDFAARVSGRDATWPAFACWASKSAGRFIRLQTAVHRWRGRLAAAPFEEVSHQIAEGNRKVYEELAPLFAAFLEAFHDARAYDEGRVAAFTQTLRAGRTEEGEGQERLAVAFEALHRAQSEADPHRRAEWVFLANYLIGLHEQIRLQQHIQGGLVEAVSRLRGYARTLSYRLRAPAPLRRAGVSALQGMEARWKRMATEWMMHLPLSDEHLDLGDDVPPLPEEGAYPEALRVLLLPASRSLLSEWDPTPGSLVESATEDWSDLPDRMHFILELFRTRQQSPRVLAAPFSPDQEGAIRAGRVPPGPL